MSVSTWTQCGGRSNIVPLDFKAWRIVEDQSRSSTLKITAGVKEHEILEDILEKNKPASPFPEWENKLHFLLWTPFRYPPLKYGSRFGSRYELSIWYGALSIETAFAEKAYYRFLFRSHMETPFTVSIENKYSAFSVGVETPNGVDLTSKKFQVFKQDLESKTNYQKTQEIGSEMRKDGVHVFIFNSTRDPKGGKNTGIFHPCSFSYSKPLEEQVWQSHESPIRTIFFSKKDDQTMYLEYSLDSFLIEGELPRAAF